MNKKAFQSKAHLPLADRKSSIYSLTLQWSWPSDDLKLVYDLDLDPDGGGNKRVEGSYVEYIFQSHPFYSFKAIQ